MAKKISFRLCMVLLFGFFIGTVANAQSVTTRLGTFDASGVTEYSQYLYIGPGAHVTIPAGQQWVIASQYVFIAPTAIIDGGGDMVIDDPGNFGTLSESVSWAGNPTTIDGGGSQILAKVINRNPKNILLDAIGITASSGDITTANTDHTLYIGTSFAWAATHADGTAVTGNDVILGDNNFRFASSATQSGYGVDRLAVTNGSGHVIKENYTGAWIFPVGVAEGDYTPATITPTAANSLYVNVKNYASSVSDETGLTGIERTWNIYGSAAGGTAIVLQHNTSTDMTGYNESLSYISRFGTAPNTTGDYSSATAWQLNQAGASTNGTVSGSMINNITYSTLSTSATDNIAYYTKIAFIQPLIAPAMLTQCESAAGTGTSSFSLTDANATVLDGQSSTLYTVTYHTTQADATAGTSSLSSPYVSTATTLYSRVTENATGYFNTSTVTLTVNTLPTVPLLGVVTQPDCSTATGSFTITNYNASYTYIFTPSAGVVNTAGSVVAPAGTYTVTATLGACTSVASSSVTVNAQPLTPAVPILGTVAQPTCSTAEGSFTITNYDAAYTYTFTPSTGVTNNAGTITAPAGTYTVTATLGACTSVASASVSVNAQPLTPAIPVLGTVTQPTCSTAEGSFTITNYDAAYTYTFTPSTGVTNNAGTVTAPAGTYTVTATLGGCTSVASSSVTVNAQPLTPAVPVLGTVTQPTCSTAPGSFTITNYDASYTYTINPSTGVTNNAGTVTAPAGTYTVTATSGACTSDASSSALVNTQPPTPTASISAAGPFCANSTPAQLTGTPVGGIFSGTGVNIAGLFSPAVAGVGNHTITYTYTNEYGCSAVATTDVQVVSAPSLSITPAAQTICSGSQAMVTVSGDNGGTVNWTSNYFGLSGAGTTFNTGTLFNTGTASLTLTLNAVASSGSCTDNTNATVTILPEPRVIVTPSSTVVCFYEIPHFTLSSVVTGTTINWQLINNVDSSIVSSGTGSDSITLFSAPIPSGSYTLKVTGTKDGCTSRMLNVPVVVN